MTRFESLMKIEEMKGLCNLKTAIEFSFLRVCVLKAFAFKVHALFFPWVKIRNRNSKGQDKMNYHLFL